MIAAIASCAISGSGLSSMAGKRTSRSLATARTPATRLRCALQRVVCAERLGRQICKPDPFLPSDQVLNGVDHLVSHQRASRIRNPGGDQPRCLANGSAPRPAGHGLDRHFHSTNFRSNETSARSIGRPSKGMSCASSRAPSGSIQNPNTGRKPKIPKMISSNPTETRTQRDDDPLSQRRKRPAPLGSSRDIRSISRSSRSASRSRIAVVFYKIALRAKAGRSSEHRDDRLGQFDRILLLQIE